MSSNNPSGSSSNTTNTTTNPNIGTTGSGSGGKASKCRNSNSNEAGHYVATAHRAGGVIDSVKCSFLEPNSVDVVISKSRRLEVRQLYKPGSSNANATTTTNDMDMDMDQSQHQQQHQHQHQHQTTPSFSVVLSAPINGRITTLIPFRHPSSPTDYIFFITDKKKYAIISYAPTTNTTTTTNNTTNNNNNANPCNVHNLITHASGDLSDCGLTIRGNEPEHGPLIVLEPNHHSCIALHLYEGYVTILPLHQSYRYKYKNKPTTRLLVGSSSSNNRGLGSEGLATKTTTTTTSRKLGQMYEFIGPPFHCRIDERDVFSMEFLYMSKQPKQHYNAKYNYHMTSLSTSTTSTSTTTTSYMPQLALLHQDSRGMQHVISHSLDLAQKQLISYNLVNPTTTATTTSATAATNGTTSGVTSGIVSGTGITSGLNGGSNTIIDQRGGGKGTSTFLPPPMHQRLRKSRVEGGSGIIIPVPPFMTLTTTPNDNNSNSSNPTTTKIGNSSDIIPNNTSSTTSTSLTTTSKIGGVLILGHRKITYHNTADNITKTIPIPPCLIESYVPILLPTSTNENDNNRDNQTTTTTTTTLRYLLGDDSGKIHILALVNHHHKQSVSSSTSASASTSIELHIDTLGEVNISSSLLYLDNGLFFLGSQFSDSQLVQILDEPIEINRSLDNYNDVDVDMGMGIHGLGTNPLLHGKNITYLSVIEEYVNLGPIVDFDLVPTTHCMVEGESNRHHHHHHRSHSHSRTSISQNRQSMAITASGAGKDGSIRLVSNGIGMVEHAAVEFGGIKGMWNIRKLFNDSDDTFLIQSYVGQTRILGVAVDDDDNDDNNDDDNDDDESEKENESGLNDSQDSSEDGGATLEEVQIDGIDAGKTTLFAGNISTSTTVTTTTTSVDGNNNSSLMIQITEMEIRIIDLISSATVCTWSTSSISSNQIKGSMNVPITVAAANEFGQIVLALGGGILMYLRIVGNSDTDTKIEFLGQTVLDREISCLNLNAFDRGSSNSELMDVDDDFKMEIDEEETSTKQRSHALNSTVVAVGLWDDHHVRLLSLNENEALKELDRVNIAPDADSYQASEDHLSQHLMARSLCFVTLKSTANVPASKELHNSSSDNKVDMLLVGLGDGGLVSFVVDSNNSSDNSTLLIHSRKEVSIGTRAINLVPFYNHTSDKGTCVLATGDRPTVIYLAGGGGSNKIPKLCYSNINLEADSVDFEDEESLSRTRFERLVVNVATPFHSSVLFSTSNALDKNYSLCISDDSTLRLGMIDDIQKLHVTTHKLGMAPRRVTYHESGRVVCVGCIDDGSGNTIKNSQNNIANKGNCIRFFDDTSFEEVDRIDLDPFEMILSMVSMQLKVNKEDIGTQVEGSSTIYKQNQRADDRQEAVYRSFLVVGTAYSYPDEDEPSRGRILLLHCDIRGSMGAASQSALTRKAVQVTEVQVAGGVYSISSFYDGTMLATINAKTRLCRLVGDGPGSEGKYDLKIDSAGHRGHILSLMVRSMAESDSHLSGKKQEQIAIVGDLARSISVIKHYPEYGTLEEVARDFNQNWVTAIEMLTHDIYLGGENFNNLFILRRNPNAASEEVRARLDTVGLFNLGEMVNKFKAGSLVIPNNSSNNPTSVTVDLSSNTAKAQGRKAAISVGSQTLYGTIDGTIGTIMGFDAQTAAFLSSLERAMACVITPVGNLKHDDFRAFCGERRQQGSKGFIDGDLVELFVDLDREMMELVVKQMNNEGKWKLDESMTHEIDEQDTDKEMKSLEDKPRAITVSDVIAIVEEISMLH